MHYVAINFDHFGVVTTSHFSALIMAEVIECGGCLREQRWNAALMVSGPRLVCWLTIERLYFTTHPQLRLESKQPSKPGLYQAKMLCFTL